VGVVLAVFRRLGLEAAAEIGEVADVAVGSAPLLRVSG
jgi:hypothetical protein